MAHFEKSRGANPSVLAKNSQITASPYSSTPFLQLYRFPNHCKALWIKHCIKIKLKVKSIWCNRFHSGQHISHIGWGALSQETCHEKWGNPGDFYMFDNSSIGDLEAEYNTGENRRYAYKILSCNEIHFYIHRRIFSSRHSSAV